MQRRLSLERTAAESSPQRMRPSRSSKAVGVSNPKSLAFLAALLPQYAEPAAGAAAPQMLFLGTTFCLIAVVGDAAWVLVAARARSWLPSHQGGRSGASIAGGLVMIGLGLVLAASSR